MILKRTAILACAVAAILFCGGCGDTFRPVATPITRPGGDRQRAAHMLVISDNGANQGTISAIDVAGDTNVGTVNVGRNPVHIGVLPSGVAFVANLGDDSLSTYAASIPTTPATTISLTPGAHPVFVGSTESGAAYVVQSGLNSVAVISQSQNAVIAEVPVGSNPVALAETPDRTKIYVVNQGSNSLTVIGALDHAVTGTIAVGSSPVYAVASSDSAFVFVVNQGSNSVSVINTATNTAAVPDITVGSGPNYAFFDSSLKRVYVTNPGNDTISIIDVTTGTPFLISTLAVTGAPCSGSHPISVTAIAGGTRAYVANRDSNNVCVLSTTNNSFIRSIAVGTTPVSIAASTDGSKVLVANSGSGSVTDIRTSDDTVAATITMAPTSCGGTSCAPQAAGFVAQSPI